MALEHFRALLQVLAQRGDGSAVLVALGELGLQLGPSWMWRWRT